MCKADRHRGRASTQLPRTPRRSIGMLPSVSLWLSHAPAVSSRWKPSISFHPLVTILQPQAGCGWAPLHPDKGKVPSQLNTCCPEAAVLDSVHKYLVSPPCFLIALLEPCESNSSEKGYFFFSLLDTKKMADAGTTVRAGKGSLKSELENLVAKLVRWGWSL